MNNHIPNNAALTADDHDPLLKCPTCGLPAEMTDRFTHDGAPLEHFKLVCVGRHWHTLPVDQLAASAPAAARAGLALDPSRSGSPSEPGVAVE